MYMYCVCLKSQMHSYKTHLSISNIPTHAPYLDGTAHEAGTLSVATYLVIQTIRIFPEIKGFRDSTREVLHSLRGLPSFQSLVATVEPIGVGQEEQRADRGREYEEKDRELS